MKQAKTSRFLYSLSLSLYYCGKSRPNFDRNTIVKPNRHSFSSLSLSPCVLYPNTGIPKIGVCVCDGQKLWRKPVCVCVCYKGRERRQGQDSPPQRCQEFSDSFFFCLLGSFVRTCADCPLASDGREKQHTHL